MKHKILLYLIIGLMLITTGTAYNTTLSTQALGIPYALIHYSPYYLETYSSIPAYYILTYPGEFSIALSPDVTNNAGMWVLNITGGVETWTEVYCGYSVGPGTVWYNVSSNTGVIKFAVCSGFGTPSYVYPQNINITWGTPDYSWRNFTAGATYQMAYVNMYNGMPSSTFYHNSGSVDGLVNDFGSFGYSDFSPNCAFSGLRDYTLTTENYSLSQSNDVFMNIEPLPALAIATKYPGTSNLAYSRGTVGNFTITSNNIPGTSAVSWYVNGGLVSSNKSGYSFSYEFDSVDTYIVEAQLEDWNCNQYPTVNWTVNVGKLVTIQGQVRDNNGNPIYGADVFFHNPTEYAETFTNDTGNYEFGLEATSPPTFFYIDVSKSGYDTLPTTNITLTPAGGLFNTVYVRDFVLNKSQVLSSVVISANDFATSTYLSGYTLNLYSNSLKVLTITNGVKTYNISGTLYTPTNLGNPTIITNIPSGSLMSATITKTGYTDTGNVGFPSTYSWTETDYQNIVFLYLSFIQNYTTSLSANWSGILPIDGSTINVTLNNEVQMSGNITTDSNYYSICLHYAQTGHSYSSSCYSVPYSGSGNYAVSINALPNTYYTFYFTATNGAYENNSGLYSFYTTATVTPITIPPITIPPTTPPVTVPPTIPIITNTTVVFNITPGTANNVNFNCSNLTGKLKNGDVFHCATCPFIIILGVSMFYGLALLFILLAIYKISKNLTITSVMGLIYTSTFLALLPQPTLNYLVVGTGFTLFLGIYDQYKKL